MRRSILHTAVASLLALTLAGCAKDVDPTGPTPGARSNALVPIGPLPPRPPRPDPNDFNDIVAGDNHTCARKNNNKVYCWGLDHIGQTGFASTKKCASGNPCVDRPTLVMKLSGGFDTLRAVRMDAGSNHTCILDTASDAWCWGDGDQGQLGFAVGSYGWPYEPLPVVGGLKFSSIAAGSMSTCGTTTSGMYCWGRLMNRAAVPTQVSSYNGFDNVVVGDLHACAMEIVGSYRAVDCWGNNTYGQIGIDPAQWQNAPFALRAQFGTSVSRVATQQSFTCVDQTSGTVQCVGYNGWGQNGNGSYTPTNGVPQTVGGGQLLHGVSTGPNHACALDVNNAAWCWGNGYYGQLGSGASNVFNTPQQVVGGRAFRAIAAGYQHTCAIGTDNHLYCWGNNNHGQLGTQYPGSWMWSPVQALDPIS